MPNNADKKEGKKGGGTPRPSNDQLGENAGEGRLAKEQDKKQPKK
jgi:hypothetical protein